MKLVTEEEFSDILASAVDACEEVASVRSFQDARVLTDNVGLVIRMASGEVFQVTIVRSR